MKAWSAALTCDAVSLGMGGLDPGGAKNNLFPGMRRPNLTDELRLPMKILP